MSPGLSLDVAGRLGPEYPLMSESVVLFLISVLLIGAGSEGFARGLSRLGVPGRYRFLMNGLCFSAPVLAVSFAAGFGGYPRTAVAIAVGSHIANVGLVLALATLARPVVGTRPEIRTAIPLLVCASLLAWFLARDNALSLVDGVVLLGAAIGVGVLLVRESSPLPPPVHAPSERSWIGVVLAVAGLGWMIGAAVLLVQSMEGVVKEAGIGGIVFGLTAVAGGISVRNIAAAIVAARRGEGDLVLEGAIGGSLINLLFGLGVLAVGIPVPMPDRMLMDVFPAAAIATMFLISVRVNGLRTRRWEGLLQLATYIGFVLWLLPRG